MREPSDECQHLVLLSLLEGPGGNFEREASSVISDQEESTARVSDATGNSVLKAVVMELPSTRYVSLLVKVAAVLCNYAMAYKLALIAGRTFAL